MQQRLKSYQPILTPIWIVGIFLGFGLVFLTLGIVMLVYTERVIELNSGAYERTVPVGSSAFVDVAVTDDMTAPVYVYYELTEFYQNNRRYVQSMDNNQLEAGSGVKTSAGAYSTNCDPTYESSYTNATNKVYKQLYPCGLVATSVFNDTFTFALSPKSGSAPSLLSVNESPDTISWSQDVSKKFNQANPFHVPSSSSPNRLIDLLDMWILKTFSPQICVPSKPNVAPYLIPVAVTTNPDGMEIVDCDFSNTNSPTCSFESPCVGDFHAISNPAGWGIDNAHFINWMRTAGLSTFRKLYGKIDTDLKAGDTIRIGVQSNFPAASYGGEKRVVLSTATWIGGKNNFLGIAYIVLGAVALVFAAVYAIMNLRKPLPTSDIDYLDWGANRAR